jgi:hypothetical protein
MSNIGYNERSWGIDIISEINSIVSQINKPIKRASGELTVRGSNSLFPDVILFGERNMESYIQGWELKFPDTNISDNELINNATKKAKRLKLNSFLLWNVTTAVLYVADSNGFFSIQKTWSDLSHITRRDQVINAQNEWLTLLKKIINDLNYFFEEGKITSRTVIDSFSDNGVIDFIINNTTDLETALKLEGVRNSNFEAKINTWWKNCKTEYQEFENQWQALTKLTLISWTNKIIFTHIMRKYFAPANDITKLSKKSNIHDAISFFKYLSSKCDFYNIFKPQFGEDLLPHSAWEYFLELNIFLSQYETSSINQEFLKKILEKTILESERKSFGQYSTPSEIAELLTRLSVVNKESIVFDGCCGTGTIARAVYNLKKEYNLTANKALDTTWASDKFSFPLQLTTMSIASPENMGMVMNIFQKDLLDLKLEEKIEFQDPLTGDIITKKFPKIQCFISNLPFVKQEEIDNLFPDIDEINQFLSTTLGEDVSISRKSDLYVFLIFYIWKILDEKGSVGVIISNSWLGTEFGKVFRKLLTKFYKIKYVITSGKGRWFKNAKVVTNILILEKISKVKSSNEINLNDKTLFIVLEETLEKIQNIKDLSDSILSKEENSLLTYQEYDLKNINYIETLGLEWSSLFSDLHWLKKIEKKIIKVNNLFKITRGERRGWDNMFYPESGHEIENEYLKPILKSSINIDKLVAEPDANAFCCSRSVDELITLGHNGALNWINRFKQLTNTDGVPLPESLYRKYSLWYEFKPSAFANLIVSMNPDERIFVAKLSKLSLVNQRLISFSSIEENLDIDLCHALLNSLLGTFFLEALGFGRGMGVLDLNSTKLGNNLSMLNPNLLKEQDKKNIKNLFKPILAREIYPLPKEQIMDDRIIFEEAILNAYEIIEIKEDVKNALLKMYQIRKSVNY